MGSYNWLYGQRTARSRWESICESLSEGFLVFVSGLAIVSMNSVEPMRTLKIKVFCFFGLPPIIHSQLWVEHVELVRSLLHTSYLGLWKHVCRGMSCPDERSCASNAGDV